MKKDAYDNINLVILNHLIPSRLQVMLLVVLSLQLYSCFLAILHAVQFHVYLRSFYREHHILDNANISSSHYAFGEPCLLLGPSLYIQHF